MHFKVSLNTVRVRVRPLGFNGYHVASLLEPIDTATISATALVVYAAVVARLGVLKHACYNVLYTY